MADGSVVIGVQLDTAAFAASAAQLENQILTLGTRLNTSMTASLANAGVGDGMAGAFAGITAAASSMAETLRSTIASAAAGAIAAFSGAPWSQAGSGAMTKTAEGIRAGSPGVSAAAQECASRIRSALESGSWAQIGQNMMQGIADGVRNAGSEVIAAIREVSLGTENAVKEHFRINSPSALMRDEVGVMISRGIADGITGGASFVSRAAESAGTKNTFTAPAGGRAVTQNIYLRDSDTSPYQTARRIKKESEAAARI